MSIVFSSKSLEWPKATSGALRQAPNAQLR